MLLAVLEKRCGFKLGQFDVFLNVAGGLKIQDPANDLAVWPRFSVRARLDVGQQDVFRG